jgi:hypothetical protein
MKIIELGNSFSADQPTGVIHRKERRPARKIGPKTPTDLPKAGT